MDLSFAYILHIRSILGQKREGGNVKLQASTLFFFFQSNVPHVTDYTPVYLCSRFMSKFGDGSNFKVCWEDKAKHTTCFRDLRQILWPLFGFVFNVDFNVDSDITEE